MIETGIFKLRDPFVLAGEDCYYLYGTPGDVINLRAKTFRENGRKQRILCIFVPKMPKNSSGRPRCTSLTAAII